MTLSTRAFRYSSACCAVTLSCAVLTTAHAAGAPTLTFVASPTNIGPGAATSVSWSSTNTSYCTASGAWGGKLAVRGTRNVVLYKTGTLYLTCKGAGGQVQKNVVVTVTTAPTPPPNPLPSVTLSAAPNSVAAGGRTALTWSSSNATSCAASGEWSGTRATAGSESSSVLSNPSSKFTLTCAGPGGQASSTATVAVAAPSTGSYTTPFDRNEAPLSEDGMWHRAANNFTNVKTSGGVAFGTNGVSDTYDDSYALLSGFGPDQTITAVVQRSSSLNTSVTHEAELLLRFADSSSGARGYECLFAFYGGVQIVRWNGTQGNYTVLQSTAGSENLGRGLATGDVIKANITGNVISLYVNGTLLARATDSAFTTGQPGIGFFTRPGGNSAHLALTQFTATSQ